MFSFFTFQSDGKSEKYCDYEPTIFRRMIAKTAFTVKKPATTIITTATGRFDRSTLMEAIHPLSTRDKQTWCDGFCTGTPQHRFT